MALLPQRPQDRKRQLPESELEMIPSYTVFLAPDLEPETPNKYEEVVDLLRAPNGVVRMVDKRGLKYERKGEVIRVRMNDLPARPESEAA